MTLLTRSDFDGLVSAVLLRQMGIMDEWTFVHPRDVQERVRRCFEQDTLFRAMIRRNATERGNVVVVDLRQEPEIDSGNRFVLYTMFPSCNISIQILWDKDKRKVVFTCGHSIINRMSYTDVGSLMLKYGGGGHKKVESCQTPLEEADKVLERLVEHMNEDG